MPSPTDSRPVSGPGTLVDPGHMSSQDFERLARFIHAYSGIKMPASKRTMVEGRLRRRLRTTGHATFASYCRFLFEDNGLDREALHLINAVTTNKTDFFREPEHFRRLTGEMLPDLANRREITGKEPLTIWSAAASNGAEAYSLAMTCESFGNVRLPYSIIATDICTEVLETGIRGIYPDAMFEPVPTALRERFVRRHRDRARGLGRIVPELRRRVRFGRLNLMDTSYGLPRDMDIIFCRNILIYFDKLTQQQVLRRLSAHLRPGGYLVLGHSESLSGTDLPLEQRAPTIFRHP